MKILITGIAGCGKTTISNELNRLGYIATDLDTNNICSWVNKKNGLEVEYMEAAGPQWIKEHRWQASIPRLSRLLSQFSTDKDIFVTGKVARVQVAELSKMFDLIFLLKPDDDVIIDRLATRTSNHKNFAKTNDEIMIIINDRYEFEKVCLDNGALVHKNNGKVKEVLEFILREVNNMRSRHLGIID